MCYVGCCPLHAQHVGRWTLYVGHSGIGRLTLEVGGWTLGVERWWTLLDAVGR